MKICIVEDQAILRNALIRLLKQSELAPEIIWAADGSEAVTLIRAEEPDIVLMDINMPGQSGIDVTRAIAPELSQVKVIALSEYESLEYLREMVVAGAAGYITKQAIFEEILTGITEVRNGGFYFSRTMLFLLLQDYFDLLTGHEKTALTQLTPRELDVLRLLSQGNTSADIASELDVTPKTVANHRQNIMNKLDIHHVAGLTKYALQHGLTK